MNMRFKDRVIVISGAASGIGAKTATLFANEGATVYALDINPIENKSKNIIGLCCNVSSYEQVQQQISYILDKENQIHHLFCSAGIYYLG